MEVDRFVLTVDGERRDLYIRRGSTDQDVLRQVFLDHDYDLSRLRRFEDLLALLRHGRARGRRPLVVDAGANIGMSTVYFASQLSDALVVAIEPEASNYQLLLKNTEGLSVLPLPCALASGNSRVQVNDVGLGEWGFRTAAWNGSESGPYVNTVAIPEIFAAADADYFPFIVKIDIEGGEKDVFSGDTDWIENTPLIIIELHDWLLPGEGTSAPFLKAVADLNRDFVYIRENVYSICATPKWMSAKR